MANTRGAWGVRGFPIERPRKNTMPDYRLYFLDAEGKVSYAVELQAATTKPLSSLPQHMSTDAPWNCGR
jgi:hypothetical protein